MTSIAPVRAERARGSAAQRVPQRSEAVAERFEVGCGYRVDGSSSGSRRGDRTGQHPGARSLAGHDRPSAAVVRRWLVTPYQPWRSSRSMTRVMPVDSSTVWYSEDS